jgi:hypothetical protein
MIAEMDVNYYPLENYIDYLDADLRTTHSATGATSLVNFETLASYVSALIIDPSRTPYALVSAPTVIVTRAMGDTVALAPTNAVVITMDTSTYSTNAAHTLVMGLDLLGVSHTVTFATNTIYGAETAGFVATNNVYSFTLHKGWMQTRFEILKGGLTQ